MSVIEQLARRIAELERRVRELEARENATFNASNITSGTLSTDRYSAFADLQAESKIGQRTGLIPTADDMRFPGSYRPPNIEDFTTATPSGWSWAESPFVTPPNVFISRSTILYATEFTSSSRAFFYRSAPSGFFTISTICGVASNSKDNEAGMRVDDGTDSNYVEFVFQYNAGMRLLFRRRTGDGTPSEVATSALWFSPPAPIVFYTGGTAWSDWYVVAWTDWYGRVDVASASGLSWTPSRIGITARSTGASWMGYYWDLFGWQFR